MHENHSMQIAVDLEESLKPPNLTFCLEFAGSKSEFREMSSKDKFLLTQN